MGMTKGTVKRLKADKGFGFIRAQDGTEYFFHHSAVEGGGFDQLREGQAVEFTPTSGSKGPRAESVRAR